MTQGLAWTRFRFGRAGNLGKDLAIGFDLRFPTQRFQHGWAARGQLCDPPLVATLTGFLEPGDTFIDIGSHIGYYALLALQQVGRHGCVFACEPNPETYRVLLANALANRAANFFPVGCALGETAGTATLFLNDGDEGMSSLVVATDRSTSVTVATLDELHALLGFAQVRMVKIDVEGFEQQVIAGGGAFLRDVRPESLVFEVNQMLPGVDLDADLEIRRHLAVLGYDCYLIRPWLNVPDHPPFPGDGLWARLSPDRKLVLAYGNVLATRRAIAAPPFQP